MKHLKTFENIENPDIEKDLLNILHQELYTEECEISWDGKECAVKEIIKYLTKLDIDLNLYLNSKKYNL